MFEPGPRHGMTKGVLLFLALTATAAAATASEDEYPDLQDILDYYYQ